MTHGDGDGWTRCDAGHTHWGRHGAAGLLLGHPAGGGVVLLAHRARWSHHGGTWGIPGGARDSHESAREAALREAAEETGLDPAAVTVVDETVDDHGSWSYVTVRGVLAPDDAAPPPELEPVDGEATELRWVPVDAVTHLALHPGFAASWDPCRAPTVGP